MVTYKQIIITQREKMSKSINWWPIYLFHFTDIHNAINIIDKEYIYGRKKANEKGLMNIDNASTKVIEITNEEATKYARLYMRPRTPTQYHNEGYKPAHIRESNLDANCPVPIFFLLDSERTLLLDGVKFIEKGLAGNNYDNTKIFSGEENFSKLNFEKIFHDGAFQHGSDIVKYRHTEVIRENGIPVSGLIRGIACRSVAEKQTLLYLLGKISIDKYMKYRDIISYKPEIDLFFNNGVYIKEVRFENGKFNFYLNDSSGRYNKNASNDEDIEVKINIDWLGDNVEVLERTSGFTKFNYKETVIINFKPERDVNSNTALVEVNFDNHLIYLNIIKTDEFEIV